MKINIFNSFEPLPVPKINFERPTMPMPEFNLSDYFTSEQIDEIRLGVLEYIKSKETTNDK